MLADALAKEIAQAGPIRKNWNSFGPLNEKNTYHCHLKDGRPTYVACWRIEDKNIKIVEIYYAGTHENALTKTDKQKRSPCRKKSIPWRESAKQEIAKYTEIGAMVRAGRYKADLTQKQLADKLEILPHHVSEMEHGKRPVSKKMAHKLGALFNLDYRLFL